jgi:hypothetical protein
MKCRSCDTFLNIREASRKSAVTEEYLDLCDHCFRYVREDFHDVEENPEYLDDNNATEDEAFSVDDLEGFSIRLEE